MTKVLNTDFFAPEFNGNTEIKKLAAALAKNSLINQNPPQSPMKIYHSKKDDFVPYGNAVAAAAWKNAELIELTTAGHSQAGIEFMLRYMGVWQFVAPVFAPVLNGD